MERGLNTKVLVKRGKLNPTDAIDQLRKRGVKSTHRIIRWLETTGKKRYEASQQ